MRVIRFIFLCLLFMVTLTNCFNNSSSWTEEQRQDFKTKCSQTDSFNNLVFLFKGFDNSEFDSILVEDFNDTILLDSFKVYVWPAQSPYDKERKVRSASIDKMMNINHKYHIIIPGQKPYILADMKMIMWPEYSEDSENYGCVMGGYTIDGVRCENNRNPTFIKRDAK